VLIKLENEAKLASRACGHPNAKAGVSPEDIRRSMAQRPAEFAQRRAAFDDAVATPTP
jgi:hypothetical protein